MEDVTNPSSFDIKPSNQNVFGVVRCTIISTDAEECREKINEEQIALALKTVECKDRVDFTRRAADITAERQVPIIEEHADELFAVRKTWDDTVAEAQEYIAAHPELFEPPK